jgi:hypothetical protein
VLPCLAGLLQEAISEARVGDAEALAVATAFVASAGRGRLPSFDPNDLRGLAEEAVALLVGVAADAVSEGMDLDLDPMNLAELLLRALEG